MTKLHEVDFCPCPYRGCGQPLGPTARRASGRWLDGPRRHSTAIVASNVGGIPDQITDGEHGLLIDDPSDLAAFAAAVNRLLTDRPLAEELGAAARQRALDEYLVDRHLEEYASLVSELL